MARTAAARTAAAPAAPAKSPSSVPQARRAGALAALAALLAVYVALAVPFAADGSRIVLATDGGSPDWLLGPFHALVG